MPKLPYYWLTIGAVLARFSLAVLVKLLSRDIIDSWHTTGLLLPQYNLLLLVKYRQVSYANRRNSTSLVLAVKKSKYWLLTDIGISLAVRAQLVFY